MKHYENFDLLITKAGRGYRAQIVGSPVGEGDARFRAPAQMGNRLTAMARPVATQDDARAVGRVADELGDSLYLAVFGGVVGRQLEACIARARERGEGLRLRLRPEYPRSRAGLGSISAILTSANFSLSLPIRRSFVTLTCRGAFNH